MPSIINSDDGVVSGTSGLKTTGGNDGITAFQQNGTERMRVDSSGNVGIGTSSPNGRLDITSTSAGANTNTLFLTNASSNASTATSLVFGVSTGPTTRNATIRGINTGGNAIDLAFLTSNGDVPVERMRVLNTGNILCLAGGSTTATGTGIAFPATQSASSDANTLDDYEEGTWTPGLTSSGVVISATLSGVGRYTKIGNTVALWGLISVSAVSSATGSYLRITGIPFSFATGGGGGLEGMTSGTIGPYGDFTNLNASDNVCVGASGGTELNIWIASGNGSYGTGLGGSNVKAGTSFYFSIVGRVA